MPHRGKERTGAGGSGVTIGSGLPRMDSAAILNDVERLLMQALQLLDKHGLGGSAAPHIDLGLYQIRDEAAALKAGGRGAAMTRSVG